MRIRSLLISIAWIGLAQAALAQTPMMTPTTEHKDLARDEGIWDAEGSIWMTADAEPMKSTGVETNKMFGDLWLVSEFEGEFAGEKFYGKGTTGYDPVKKKYIGTWFDTMSPFIYTLEGDYDADSHTATMMMEGVDAMDGQPKKWKVVTKYEGDDAKTFTMYQADASQADGWMKSMELKYKRRK